jgi:hypothetical protein
LSNALIYLDALPPRTSKAVVLRFVCDRSGIESPRIGAIEVDGRRATVEVPSEWAMRIVRALDGARLNDANIRARCDSIADESSPGNSTTTATSHKATATREDHFARLARLLKIESEAAAEQTRRDAARRSGAAAEQTGESLVELILREENVGLGGRALLAFGKRDRTRRLPWTRLGSGSPVVLSVEGERTSLTWRGVVSDRSPQTIEVALADFPEVEDDRATFRIDLSSDEIARQRQSDALARAAAARGDRLAELVRVLRREQPPRFGNDAWRPSRDIGLNQSQREAIRFAMHAADIAIIHGPPGTGKTTTVAELIRETTVLGQKVLACAPSNMAVDNLLERLLASKVRAIRLGHPARVMPALRANTLDLLVEEHEDTRVARKLVQEARKLFDKAGKYTRAKPAPGARQEMRSEARALLADARRIEALAVEQILNQADVICATLTGLDSEVLGQRRFDLAVIDEACQTVEPACWIPLLRSERVVLAGDHCQLPPTIVSPQAAREGFGVSLLERLADLESSESNGQQVLRRLDVQYRMHVDIMEFSSAQFYNGTLIADASVKGHLLRDLPGVRDEPLTATAVDFIDTAGASYDEEQEADGASRLNREEAALVVRKVQALLDAGVAAGDIAVIAPYAAQVRLLRDRIVDPAIEVDSVDGFQGREKEAVVISLVRSNGEGEIGFLADTRRMNVALTRARRKLIVIGDSATLAGHDFYRDFLETMEGLGAYRTVWEEAE